MGTAVGGLAGIKLLTGVLDPVEFGRLSLANTLILLIGANLFGPLGQGFMRYWSIARERNLIPAFDYLCRRLSGILILCVSGSAILFFWPIHRFWGLGWSMLAALSIPAGALTGWAAIRVSVLMAARKRKTVALYNTVVAFSKPLLGAVAAAFFFSSASAVLMAYLLVLSAGAAWANRFLRRVLAEHADAAPLLREKDGSSQGLKREVLSFSLPFFAWSAFGWLHQSCDRWALQSFQGSEVVGAFSVIALLSVYPLVFGSGFLNTLVLPIAFDRAESSDNAEGIKSAQRLLRLTVVGFAGGTLLLVAIFSLCHQWLVLVVSNSEYARFSHLLPGLTAAWGTYYLGQMLTGFGFLWNQTALYILPIAVSGLLAAAVTFGFAAIGGPVGVVWGIGLSGTVYCLWLLRIAWRLSRKGLIR
jgi:O-antigen/teichoic acid export membrane protein